MAQDLIVILRGLGIVSKHAINNLDVRKSTKSALAVLEATKPAKFKIEKIATNALNNPKVERTLPFARSLPTKSEIWEESEQEKVMTNAASMGSLYFENERTNISSSLAFSSPSLPPIKEELASISSSSSHLPPIKDESTSVSFSSSSLPPIKDESASISSSSSHLPPNKDESASLSSSSSSLPQNKDDLASISSPIQKKGPRKPIEDPSQKISSPTATSSIAKHSKQTEASDEKQMDQRLSQRSRERKVPASRVSRFLTFGGLAVGVGMGALTEGVQRSLGLKDTSTESKSLILNEANASRIVNTLCHVRGAALKLGQMISIQDNNLVSPQLQAVFERVRQSADFMPTWQMERVMRGELGENWREKFAKFESKPFAAASIGQVHYGQLHDGRDVAIKIQYPGVAEGIDSDISNLTTILKTWNILPRGFYIENVIASAKRELAWEVDYLREAECGIRFKKLVEPYPQYYVPEVISDLTTKRVLTTELIHGIPVDKMIGASQEIRNKISSHLLELSVRELFEFKFMQTDPNWSNFFYNPKTQQISLLDFGACRSYGDEFVDNYIKVIKSAADQNRDKVLFYLKKLGFLTGYENKAMEKAHSDAVLILGEAFAFKDNYDFGRQDVTRRITTVIPVMLHNRLTPPPEESYSLHRKMSGMFLLCTKLKAKINCSSLFEPIYNKYTFTTTSPEL